MEAFKNVIGYEAVKKELAQIIDVLNNEDVYSALGVKKPGGLLLYGPPGIGKTTMANALIEASGWKCFTCRRDGSKDRDETDFTARINTVFEKATAESPAIVFLDDMDKFANEDANRKDAEEYIAVQAGIDRVRGKDIFVVATANNIKKLPDSLIRAGRFDTSIELEAPSGQEAIKIIDHYLDQKSFVDKADPETIARLMAGSTCAELEMIVNKAGIYAGFERAEKISGRHLVKACLHSMFEIPEKILDGEVEPVDLSDKSCERAQVIWHEAGHAVVSEALAPGSVSLVCSFGTSKRKRGCTSCDLKMVTDGTESIEVRVMTGLGGMAAVEHIFGKHGIGNGSDISAAYHQIEKQIEAESQAGLYYSDRNHFESDEMWKAREHVTAALVQRYYNKTMELLCDNHELLVAVAKELAEKGYLLAEDIERIKERMQKTGRQERYF